MLEQLQVKLNQELKNAQYSVKVYGEGHGVEDTSDFAHNLINEQLKEWGVLVWIEFMYATDVEWQHCCTIHNDKPTIQDYAYAWWWEQLYGPG